MARKPGPRPNGIGPDPVPVINTTPLIDLMLVLIVMFIVAVPVATHKVPLDLPQGSPRPADRAVHRIDLDAAGALFWDGRPIPPSALAPLLARMAADPAAPELHIAAHAETRYERVDETLAAIRRSGITRMGFVGNERFAAALDR
ncbi:MAG TPA: biopolymer transporter ExbD [Allosphingosinicella sp.]|nr:biopolymer transporter ExbD [Allosphingosinicella sp.]